MKMHEIDLIEFLIKEGHTDIAEDIKDYRKNTIKMCEKNGENVIAKGTSKIGGFPDLPPEIPYPTMSGYSCKRGNDTERYEKSAMQLVAQSILRTLLTWILKTGFRTRVFCIFSGAEKSTQFTKPTNGLKALLTTSKIQIITR